LSKDVKQLFYYLSGYQDENIFENELIKVLLIQQNYTNQILWKIMIPYFVYMFSVLYYFTYNITNYNGEPDPGYF
jgi:hypothetical protein